MKFLKRFFLPAIMTVSLIFGCAVNKSSVGGFNLISVAEEQQLGEKFALEIEKQHKIVKDPQMQSYIVSIRKRNVLDLLKI